MTAETNVRFGGFEQIFLRGRMGVMTTDAVAFFNRAMDQGTTEFGVALQAQLPLWGAEQLWLIGDMGQVAGRTFAKFRRHVTGTGSIKGPMAIKAQLRFDRQQQVWLIGAVGIVAIAATARGDRRVGFLFAFKGGVAIETQLPLRARQQVLQVGLMGVVAGQAVAIGDGVVQFTAAGELTMTHGTDRLANIGSKGGEAVEVGVVLGMAHGAAVAVSDDAVNHLFFVQFSMAVKAFHPIQLKPRRRHQRRQQKKTEQQCCTKQKVLANAVSWHHVI